MPSLEALPFGPDSFAQPPAIDDSAFRYEPHVLCPACRALLTLALERHRQRGAQLSEYIETAYDFGQLCASAKLGCHVCALLEQAMWTRPLDIVADDARMRDWKVAFVLLPATEPEALLTITIECAGGGGSLRGYSLPVFSKDRAGGSLVHVYAPTAGLSLGRSTGDEETFDVAKAWLDTCLKEHKMCAQNDDAARVVRPNRLLQLDGTISLVDSTAAAGQEYVALSHCWGRQVRVPRLLAETEAELRAGVELSYLPNTFQHAVLITRKLGFRFLWIDSLCIIQDSAEDWRDQAEIMALVYNNSVLTIAALKSSGSHEGCFTDARNSLRLRPCVSDELGVTVSSWNPGRLWEVEVNTSGYGASPLHSRAWVVQERYSAPRTLLYGANGIYWECRCAQASESHYCNVAWDDEANKKTWLQRLEVDGSTDAAAQQQLSSNGTETSSAKMATWKDHWIGLLKVYSSCQLTQTTDKIIAVTGLIKEIERRSKAKPRCILGLWDYDLPGMALWYRSRDIANTATDLIGRLDNNMPTWTWASVEGKCSYLLSGGEIEVASQLLLDEYEDIQLDPDDPKTGLKGWGGDLEETYSWFPDGEMPGLGVTLCAVPMQRVRIASGLWVARCLVLTPCMEEAGEVFTRVGVVFIRYGDKRDDPFKSKDAEAQEVVSVK
ncbi:heterokaryon incompatibility protein [Apiospora phragmitis]|uniref:Heterokaryon incompatibility protein n=1 Tax=Apiospora phragmitis TaxID=2905665 RepID=A0ABR1T8L8_9PEZI